MDKYNCGTCTQMTASGHCFKAKKGERGLLPRYDTEPQNMHPCEYDEAVVATAIAAVEFVESTSYVFAKHDGKNTAVCLKPKCTWNLDNRNAKFCSECGRPFPTADQLSAMYEAWKAEREERHGEE